MKVLHWAPEERGGIRTYLQALDAAFHKVGKAGWEFRAEYSPTEEFIRVASEYRPEVIHIQHEFGLFGGKTPGFYRFPKVVRRLRQVLPKTALVATAHSVIPPGYRYPVQGRGLQAPIRAAANQVLLPALHQLWGHRTWGGLNGVIVHSGLQKSWVEQEGQARVQEIPHFVGEAIEAASGVEPSSRKLLLFGFFSRDKGQDIALDALMYLPEDVQLVLAGGARRPQDLAYLESCHRKIELLGLQKRVTITGFVPEEEIGKRYAEAGIVLAPFRETTGSGSLAQAFARAKAVVASDLPLNQEVQTRVPGCLALFKSENPAHLAETLQTLIENAQARAALSGAARRYAELCSLEKTVQRHIDFYRGTFSGTVAGTLDHH